MTRSWTTYDRLVVAVHSLLVVALLEELVSLLLELHAWVFALHIFAREHLLQVDSRLVGVHSLLCHYSWLATFLIIFS